MGIEYLTSLSAEEFAKIDAQIEEAADPVSAARAAFQVVAEHANIIEGIPINLEGDRIIVSGGYCLPFNEVSEKKPAEDDLIIRNQWYCKKKKAKVYICEDPSQLWINPLTGLEARKICSIVNYESRMRVYVATISVAAVWGMEAEIRAMAKLKSLVSDHQYHTYFMTGVFAETSKRSKVSYLFRRLRPTIALSKNVVLCSLCTHALGYYADSWAGVMVPTDDVITHLMLMRADERKFWAKCEQHDENEILADIQ